jgi:hypothetical protein
VSEALCPVSAVLGVERDASARLVDLHAIAVVLYLIEPAHALGQAIAQGRFTGRDECEGIQHGKALADPRARQQLSSTPPNLGMAKLTQLGMPRAPHMRKDASLNKPAKSITRPNCGLVLRVTHARGSTGLLAKGSTRLLYDLNDWQRRCLRTDLDSPVMCLVQHVPFQPK